MRTNLESPESLHAYIWIDERVDTNKPVRQKRGIEGALPMHALHHEHPRRLWLFKLPVEG